MRIAILLAALLATSAAAQLTAGDIDDHLNWEQYLGYVQRLGTPELPETSLSDRVTIQLMGTNGPIAYADVSITSSEGSANLQSGSDGRLRLFPSLDGYGTNVTMTIQATAAHVKVVDLSAGDQVLQLPEAGRLADSIQVMFVVDATGSMGDEMEYLKDEIGNIAAQIQGSVEFGLTLYRDTGDDFVVKGYGFTDDIDVMRSWLAENRAKGGGDYPEAMEQGLAEGLAAQWSGGNVAKLLFLVADAPPHTENYDAFVEQAIVAREMGIHIHSLAASGVADSAEYLMRLASVLTQGRYTFLTDDSGIGNSHAEPKIACYQVTTLDDLLVRIIQSEATGARVEASASQIIREVGSQEMGVCLESGQEEPEITQNHGDSGSSDSAESTSYASDGAYEATTSADDGDDSELEDSSDSDASSSRKTPGVGVGLAILGLVFLVSRKITG